MWIGLSLAFLCSTLLGEVVAIGPTVPSTDPDMYRLTHRIPDNCDPASCDYFLGINVNEGNSSYLDIYLSGDTAGWIAIGFSTTSSMQDADVLGCSVQQDTLMVRAVDTHNIVGDRQNDLDSSGQDQTDIVEGSGTFMNGRITCTFSRLIVGIDTEPEDRDLDSDYFFLFGRGNSARPLDQLSNFPRHETTPIISSSQMNPVQDEDEPPTDSSGPQQPVMILLSSALILALAMIV